MSGAAPTELQQQTPEIRRDHKSTPYAMDKINREQGRARFTKRILGFGKKLFQVIGLTVLLNTASDQGPVASNPATQPSSEPTATEPAAAAAPGGPSIEIQKNQVKLTEKTAEDIANGWRQFQIVKKGDTIDIIGARSYKDYYKRIEFYRGILYKANGMDPTEKNQIYEGQDFFVPNPDIETLAVVPGQELSPRSLKEGNKNGPTKFLGIYPDPADPEKSILKIEYLDGASDVKQGTNVGTDRDIFFAGVIRGMPAYKIQELAVVELGDQVRE